MFRLLLITTLLVPASAAVLRATSNGPASSAGLMNLLTRTEARGSADDEFTKGCLATSKAVVAETDGSKKRVAAQLQLICSGLQLPLDVDICNKYRSTLLGHLHKDSRWNLEDMDFPLFCAGMDKVVGKFKEDLAKFSAGEKVGAPETPKEEHVTYRLSSAQQLAAEKAEEEKKVKKAKLAAKKAKMAAEEEEQSKLIKAPTDEYGSDDCRCVGIDEIEGETVIQLKKNGNASYPADLGARCEAWDKSAHPSCPGESWCAQKWCYVDPCKCKNVADLPKPSTYLPDAMYKGKPIHFSYATCGGKDSYSKEEEKKTAKDLEATCATEVDSSKWGAENCRCVGIGPQPGTTKVAIKDEKVDFPADVGAFCNAWEQDNHPDCAGDKPASWCNQSWCYVDPCSCKLPTPPKTSSYVPDANYQGKPVYYSYATCGGSDSYTKGRKEACVTQKTADACGELKKCAWTGEECLGKELVDVCDLKSEEKPKSAKSAAWTPKVIVAVAFSVLGRLY